MGSILIGFMTIRKGNKQMKKNKELLILDTALTCLLDNFMYQEEDYADLDFTEADIRDLQVSIFREIQARKGEVLSL